MKIRYARSAQNDLRNILRYGQQHWPHSAEEFMVMLRDRVEATLGHRPQSGRRGREEDTREFVLVGAGNVRHVVVYKPPVDASNDLVVVRVLHGAQQWP